MGLFERWLRIVIAIWLAMLSLTGTIQGLLGGLLLILAVNCFLSGLISFCPLYGLLGLRRKTSGDESD